MASQIDLIDDKALQIGHQQKIGPIARHDGSPPGQSEMPGRIDRSHGNRPMRWQTMGHRLSDKDIKVPFPGQIHRVAVITDQGKMVRRIRRDQTDQRVQILFRAALADHDMHPPAQFVPGFFNGGTFVVRPRAGHDIGVESCPAKPRCMAIHGMSQTCPQLAQHAFLPGDDSGKIHDLGQAQ